MVNPIDVLFNVGILCCFTQLEDNSFLCDFYVYFVKATRLSYIFNVNCSCNVILSISLAFQFVLQLRLLSINIYLSHTHYAV